MTREFSARSVFVDRSEEEFGSGREGEAFSAKSDLHKSRWNR